MNEHPGKAEKQLRDTITALHNQKAPKKFLEMTPEDVEEELQPCFDIRKEIAGLEAKLTTARNKRDELDGEGLNLVQRIVNAIKADETEGEDSPLLETMGYIIKSKRKSGLHRITPESNTSPIPKAA